MSNHLIKIVQGKRLWKCISTLQINRYYFFLENLIKYNYLIIYHYNDYKFIIICCLLFLFRRLNATNLLKKKKLVYRKRLKKTTNIWYHKHNICSWLFGFKMFTSLKMMNIRKKKKQTWKRLLTIPNQFP